MTAYLMASGERYANLKLLGEDEQLSRRDEEGTRERSRGNVRPKTNVDSRQSKVAFIQVIFLGGFEGYWRDLSQVLYPDIGVK
jgi:hypothetical protein